MLPKLDTRQKLRLRRFKMAVVTYCMWIALSLFAHRSGQLSIPDQLLYIIIGGIGLTNLYFYVMIRSGLNRRLADPSMTLQQLAIATKFDPALAPAAETLAGDANRMNRKSTSAVSASATTRRHDASRSSSSGVVSRSVGSTPGPPSGVESHIWAFSGSVL